MAHYRRYKNESFISKLLVIGLFLNNSCKGVITVNSLYSKQNRNNSVQHRFIESYAKQNTSISTKTDRPAKLLKTVSTQKTTEKAILDQPRKDPEVKKIVEDKRQVIEEIQKIRAQVIQNAETALTTLQNRSISLNAQNNQDLQQKLKDAEIKLNDIQTKLTALKGQEKQALQQVIEQEKQTLQQIQQASQQIQQASQQIQQISKQIDYKNIEQINKAIVPDITQIRKIITQNSQHRKTQLNPKQYPIKKPKESRIHKTPYKRQRQSINTYHTQVLHKTLKIDATTKKQLQQEEQAIQTASIELIQQLAQALKEALKAREAIQQSIEQERERERERERE